MEFTSKCMLSEKAWLYGTYLLDMYFFIPLICWIYSKDTFNINKRVSKSINVHIKPRLPSRRRTLAPVCFPWSHHVPLSPRSNPNFCLSFLHFSLCFHVFLYFYSVNHSIVHSLPAFKLCMSKIILHVSFCDFPFLIPHYTFMLHPRWSI